MNYEQIKGAGDRLVFNLITMGLTYVAARGWLGDSEVALLAPAFSVAINTVIGIMVNRRVSIAKSATNLGDVVITTPEIAKKTPDYPSIVSNKARLSVIADAVSEAKIADPEEAKRKD